MRIVFWDLETRSAISLRDGGSYIYYGLVLGLSYVVRLNDLKTAQHLRARLGWVLRHQGGLAKPLHAELKELFAISGLWVRNVGDRHQTKRQIQRMILRILPRLKVHSRVGS